MAKPLDDLPGFDDLAAVLRSVQTFAAIVGRFDAVEPERWSEFAECLELLELAGGQVAATARACRLRGEARARRGGHSGT